MPVSKEFIRAWRAWQHAPSPHSNQYLLRKSVSTGKVEHDLDHMESYLYAMGLDAIEGKIYEYADIASRELSDLERISAELESCEIAESAKERFRQHIGIIRAVWLEMQRLGAGDGAIQQLIPADRP
jgi:hypothetical protein